ncbi:hypothetical protein D3C86_1394060 [compost metagenome]
MSMLMPGVEAAASWMIRRMSASTSAAFSSGIMRRSSLKLTLPGTTLVLVPPSMRPTFRYGWEIPGTWEVTCWYSAFCAYRALRILTAPCSASTPLLGMAACAILPCTVTSICRQPLWAVTTS